MISLFKAANDMERLEQLQQALAKCYALALKACAEYAVELDPRSTEYFRQRLQSLDRRLMLTQWRGHLSGAREASNCER